MKHKVRRLNVPLTYFCIFTLLIILLFIQFCYLSLSKNVYGINMRQFAENRNTVTSILTAKRGTIYDIEGDVLAQNISTYTLIAYLDSSRTKDEKNPYHVVDKEYTATKLASILGEENYDYILERLNKHSKQVEFGTVGKNLTELTKLAIEELNLPGISFTETVRRYYPNGNFASYILGYSKQYTRINIKIGETYDLYNYYKSYFENYENVTLTLTNEEVAHVNDKKITGLKEGTSILSIKTNNDPLDIIVINVTTGDNFKTLDSTIVGELGIENKYDSKLQGVDGYIRYQRDKYGYKIPDTPEERVEAKNGYDIYLTLDSNIQRFAEDQVNSINSEYSPKWAIISVMDAKSGAILASATSPSYNPNSLPSNMEYNNPLISYAYEPGSVMKIYTYMCAIETGKYDGEKQFLSGSYKFDDGTVMHDWLNSGWGYINYDTGFKYSSNVGVINIIKDYLSRKELQDCFEKYGFNKKTGIELSHEYSGDISFKYDTEVMSAGYGQGISTTAIQQLQALTIIANNGVMVKPHIIEKIVDIETNTEIKTEIEKSEKLVSDKTITKMKDLMESVISSDDGTGRMYNIEGYDLIGKTGTAQISENGRYLTGSNDYIISLALMYPKDNPEIIIYAAVKQPNHNSSVVLNGKIQELVKNISKYRNMPVENDDVKETSLITSSYINKTTEEVKKELTDKKIQTIILGDGDKIINQYPNKDYKLIEDDKVFLLTNNTNFIMPDITNWSRYDVMKLCELINLDYSFEGFGYVTSQSILPGTKIDENSNLLVTLGNIKQ